MDNNQDKHPFWTLMSKKHLTWKEKLKVYPIVFVLATLWVVFVQNQWGTLFVLLKKGMRILDAMFLYVPKWAFTGVVVIIWLIATSRLSRQTDLPIQQRKKWSYCYLGIASGIIFYLYQDAALGFLKTVIAMILLLIFAILTPSASAFPMGLGGWLWWDDWESRDDNGGRHDY